MENQQNQLNHLELFNAAYLNGGELNTMTNGAAKHEFFQKARTLFDQHEQVLNRLNTKGHREGTSTVNPEDYVAMQEPHTSSSKESKEEESDGSAKDEDTTSMITTQISVASNPSTRQTAPAVAVPFKPFTLKKAPSPVLKHTTSKEFLNEDSESDTSNETTQQKDESPTAPSIDKKTSSLELEVLVSKDDLDDYNLPGATESRDGMEETQEKEEVPSPVQQEQEQEQEQQDEREESKSNTSDEQEVDPPPPPPPPPKEERLSGVKHLKRLKKKTEEPVVLNEEPEQEPPEPEVKKIEPMVTPEPTQSSEPEAMQEETPRPEAPAPKKHGNETKEERRARKKEKKAKKEKRKKEKKERKKREKKERKEQEEYQKSMEKQVRSFLSAEADEGDEESEGEWEDEEEGMDIDLDAKETKHSGSEVEKNLDEEEEGEEEEGEEDSEEADDFVVSDEFSEDEDEMAIDSESKDPENKKRKSLAGYREVDMEKAREKMDRVDLEARELAKEAKEKSKSYKRELQLEKRIEELEKLGAEVNSDTVTTHNITKFLEKKKEIDSQSGKGGASELTRILTNMDNTYEKILMLLLQPQEVLEGLCPNLMPAIQDTLVRFSKYVNVELSISPDNLRAILVTFVVQACDLYIPKANAMTRLKELVTEITRQNADKAVSLQDVQELKVLHRKFSNDIKRTYATAVESMVACETKHEAHRSRFVDVMDVLRRAFKLTHSQPIKIKELPEGVKYWSCAITNRKIHPGMDAYLVLLQSLTDDNDKEVISHYFYVACGNKTDPYQDFFLDVLKSHYAYYHYKLVIAARISSIIKTPPKPQNESAYLSLLKLVHDDVVVRIVTEFVVIEYLVKNRLFALPVDVQ